MKKVFVKLTVLIISYSINYQVTFAQQITLPALNGCLNDTVFVPVNYSHIDTLAALTLYITYDTAVLKFAGYANVNALTSGLMCGVPSSGPNAWQAVISWVDNTLNGVNLVSGKFCDLKFKYKGGSSNLNFLLSSELTGPNLGIIVPAYTNGSINPTIISHPVARHVCEEDQTIFSVIAASGSSYVWQVQNGTQWDNLQNNSTYSGVNTGSLQILRAHYSLNNKIYRCAVTKTCTQLSNPALLTVYPKPVIVLNNDTAVCSGNYVTVNATGTTGSGTLQYNWDHGLGPGISHTVLPASTSSYHLTVTDTYSCSSTDSIKITVSQLPSPAGTISGSTTVCQGLNGVIYNVPVIANASSYIWSLPAGSTGTVTNNSITVNYSVTAVPGNIVVKGHNSCGDGIASTLAISVNPIPVVPVQTTMICSGTAFTVSPVNNPPSTILPAGTTYTWSAPVSNPAGAITGGSTQPTGQPSICQTLTNITANPATTTYTVTPTSGMTGNCVGNAFTITVTINPTPVIPDQSMTICSGTAFIVRPINNPPSTVVPPGTTYTWGFPVSNPAGAITGGSAQPTGQASISQTLTNTISSPAIATYSISPTIGGCPGNIFNTTITVNPVYTFTENHSICDGETYHWQGMDYTASNTYTANYTSINGCDSIYTLHLTVNPYFSFSENHNICDGETFHWQGTDYTAANTYTANYTSINGCDSIYTLYLTVNSVGTGVSLSGISLTANSTADTYQWIDCNNNFASINGEVHQSFTPIVNGNYAVILTQGICSDTSSCINIVNVGVKNIDNDFTIKVYPNPVSSILNIETAKRNEILSFEIVNSMGQIVFKGNLIEKAVVQTENFAPGIYLIKLKNGKFFEFKKIVKE